MKQLETERLILREWRESDLEDLYEYAKSPNVGPNAGWEPHRDIEDSRKVLKKFIEDDDVWALVNRRSGKVIGSLGLHADPKRTNPKTRMIGYVLSEEYWGRGLIAEAVRRVLTYAFDELDLELVSIYHYPFNERSRRVIEKCGFQYEGTLKMASKIYNGRVYDDLCYSIAKNDYVEFSNETR